MPNNLPEIYQDDKNYSELELKFLEALFGEAEGDAKKAKQLAGYSPQKPLSSIVKSLKKEISLGTQLYLAEHAPAAVATLVKIIMSDVPVIMAKEKIMAAKEILDRAGVVKTEQKTVTHQGGVVLMPVKRPVDYYGDEEYIDAD
jgi:hypothetical protein